jgi:hypothetical protein
MRLSYLALALLLLPALAPAQWESAPGPAALHGSVAVSWYRFDDTSDSDRNYDKPSARLNLKATGLFGGNMSARLRFRTRYDDRATVIGSVPQTEWRNRFYEVSLAYDNPDSPFGFEVGRIIPKDMAGLGYLDGVMLTNRPADGWQVGVLAGTRPDWRTSDFQTTLQKYGAFVGFESGDRAATRVEVKLAGVGEYHDSTVSREFLYVRSSFHQEKKLDIYGTAEVDLNRDWREQKTGESVSLTALFLRARYRLKEDMTVGLGYDTRKNFYTYEIRSLPDSLFIDASRHGARANVETRLPGDYRLHADVGIRGMGTKDDPTYFFSAQCTKSGFMGSRTRAALRVFGFKSPYALGTNPSLRLSRTFRGGHSADITYGAYFYGIDSTETSRINQWIRAGCMAQLPAQFYLSAEYQYDWGDDSQGHRLFGEVGYRF